MAGLVWRKSTAARTRPRRLCLVCFQSPTDMGGIETVVRQMVKLYSRRGHEVHVCSGAPRRSFRTFPNGHSYYPIGTVFSQFLWPLQVPFVAGLTVYLVLLHLRYRFDVLVPQDSYLQGLAAILAGSIINRPVVVMDHGVVTNIADERWQQAWKRRHRSALERLLWPLFDAGVARQSRIFKSVARRADRLFYTGYELDEFYRQNGAEHDKIRIYDHVIDVDFFSPAATDAERTAARERLGLALDRFVINCTSRLNFEKGYREVVGGLAQLVDAGASDAVLCIGGDDRQLHQTTAADGEKRVILDQIDSLGLRDRVRLLGVLTPEQVRDLHRASDLHVYAGTMGCSFALCVLEAMACALPTIATSVPRKLKDVVTPEIGWVVPPGDAASLGEAFVAAYRRRGQLRAMGSRAREYVLTHNSYDAAAAVYDRAMFEWSA